MKNRKAQLVRLHTGITAQGTVLTSLHHEKHKCSMSVEPTGIHVVFASGEEHFVYSANIIDVLLLAEEKK